MRPFRTRVLVSILLLAPALLGPGPSGAESVAVHVAGGQRPPVLDLLDDPSPALLAVAISSDGTRAAVAVELSLKPPRCELRLYEVGRQAPATLELAGRLRDLLFSRDAAAVYVLQHKSAKKREGDTFLLTVEWNTAKARRSLRVPSSARALDHWMARDAVLIAARNEIRTVLLPGLRSGPLYRVPGENSAVASLSGNMILIGQEDGLVRVDLGAPSGREAMPIAERTDAPGAVVSLAAEPDGRGALARLADGRLFTVELGPLVLGAPHGPALDVTAPVRERPVEEPASPAVTPAPAEPSTPPAEPLPPPSPAPPSPTETTPDPPAVEPGAPEATEQKPPAEPAEPVTPEPPAPEPAADPVPGKQPAPERSGPPPQIEGRIEGPGLDRVAGVVLFGPDNILREAKRVRPTSEGRWRVDGLAPGRYRVQLDGGGGSVLITEPRFLLLTVAPGGPVQAPVFKLLRAL